MGGLVLPALASKDIAAYYVVDVGGHPHQFLKLARLHSAQEAYRGFAEDAIPSSICIGSLVVGDGHTAVAQPALVREDVNYRLEEVIVQLVEDLVC